MHLTLYPRPIGGEISAIASKSQAHRLLICAAFSDRPTKIHCAEISQDIQATVNCLTALGSHIDYHSGVYTVCPIERPTANAVLDCAESGSTLRFLLPVVAALGTGAEFLMRGRLPQRPLSPLYELLEENGICFSRPTSNTLRMQGKLRANTYRISGNISSQFISGLLFAMPLIGEPSSIMLTTKLESAPYVSMTLSAMAQFGIVVQETERGYCLLDGQTYHTGGQAVVEGDWSNAAFWLCSGAICSPICVKGLRLDSAQGDRRIVDVLRSFGATISVQEDSITVSPGTLHGIELDASDFPDLVPPIALVAACARGTTRIYGAQRLRIKESDRIASVCQALQSLGGSVCATEDGLFIEGHTLCGGSVDSCNDHRIAMMAAIASCVCSGNIELCGAEAVDKSYPKFWDDFRKLVI
ncbi:MAG: 3-phosphoshikimate 1-carboxyvinyltransferase [Ruminococcaceae bacterium]|nr:3-phosphoshikimate 1-carboxyvinyltransferase [Oscillospiraceae bacterium]